MEQVVDKLVAEITLWSNTASDDGGFADELQFQSVYWGDPGVMPTFSYPAVTVQPTADQPESETTGYEVVDLTILIGIHIDAREFFDASVEEATGDRTLVRAVSSLRRWLRRKSNRSLDGLAGVRELRIVATDYLPEVRGEVITKSAQISLVVNRQYQRQQ